MAAKRTFGPYNQLIILINCLFSLWVISLLCMTN